MKTRLAVVLAVLVTGIGTGIWVHHRDGLRPLPVFMQAPARAATGHVVRRSRATTCRLDAGVSEPPHD